MPQFDVFEEKKFNLVLMKELTTWVFPPRLTNNLYKYSISQNFHT